MSCPRSFLLLFLALVPFVSLAQVSLPPSPGFPSCEVCGAGNVVNNPTGEVVVPGQGTFTCAEFESGALGGFVDPAFCPLLLGFVQNCGCGAAADPTRSPITPPTRSPTNPPTPNPTRTPTPFPTAPPQPNPTLRPTPLPTTPPQPNPTRTPTLAPTPRPTNPLPTPTVQAPSIPPNPGFPPCSICGEGNVVNNSTGEVVIPGQGTFTCATFESGALSGFVDPAFCPALQGFVQNCACGPGSNPTRNPTRPPNPSPTPNPTPPPQQNPTSPPVPRPSPIPAPVFFPSSEDVPSPVHHPTPFHNPTPSWHYPSPVHNPTPSRDDSPVHNPTHSGQYTSPVHSGNYPSPVESAPSPVHSGNYPSPVESAPSPSFSSFWWSAFGYRTLPAESQTISETLLENISESDEFVIFGQALKESGLGAILQNPGPYTIFAPTDRAFYRSMGHEAIEDLFENEDKLRDFLLCHIVEGGHDLSTLRNEGSLIDHQGGDIEVSSNWFNRIVLNGHAQLIKDEIVASNGVIHAIDQPLAVMYDWL